MVITLQPLSPHVHVAPAAQVMVQFPAAQEPIEHVSCARHSMLQYPPGHAAMTKVAPSLRLGAESRCRWQPPLVHVPSSQVRPPSQFIVQPAPHSSMAQSGPSHSIEQPPPHWVMWQDAPSVQTIRQPPWQPLMLHSAPSPSHDVVQPPVGQAVAQSEPAEQLA